MWGGWPKVILTKKILSYFPRDPRLQEQPCVSMCFCCVGLCFFLGGVGFGPVYAAWATQEEKVQCLWGLCFSVDLKETGLKVASHHSLDCSGILESFLVLSIEASIF